MSNDDFTRWLTEVARLDAAEDVDFNADNYLDVLLELGHTPSDVRRVEATVEAELTRARQFTEFERWAEAGSQYESVLKLAPWRSDLWMEAALAYVEAYRATTVDEYAATAERWARRKIQHDPDDVAAYEVLNQLDSLRNATSLEVSATSLRRRNVILVTLAAMSLALGALGYIVLQEDVPRDNSAPPADAPPPLQEPKERARTLAPMGGATIPVVQSDLPSATDGSGSGEYALPLTVMANGRLSDIRVDASANRLEISPYGGHRRAYIRLRVNNDHAGPLSELAGALEWLDHSGQLVGSKQVTLLSSASGAIRKGEQHVFGTAGDAVPKETVAARLVVSVAKRHEARSKWPDSRLACVQWETAKPDGVELEFRLRSERRATLLWRYEFEVQNRGAFALREVKVAVTLYDEAGKPLGRTGETGISNRKFAAAAWQPPFLAHERRLIVSSPFLSTKEGARFHKACVRVLTVE